MTNETERFMTAELILEELKVILKDSFVATVRKAGDELRLRFPGGELFCLTVWRLDEKGRGTEGDGGEKEGSAYDDAAEEKAKGADA